MDLLKQAVERIEARIGKQHDVLRPWTRGASRNGFVPASLHECSAVSTYANVLDIDFEHPESGIITLGPGTSYTVKPVKYAAKLSLEEASMTTEILDALDDELHFKGGVSLSRSQKTWNVWRGTSKRRKRRVRGRSRYSGPHDFDRHPRDGSLMYYDGEWYPEDHF